MFDDEEFLPLAPDRAGEFPVSLALQGGGSFGAFTWGVLDRLLEEPNISFDIISGASAGALNAVLLADGWRKGGRDGARATLNQFWSDLRQAEPIGLLGLVGPATVAAVRLSQQMGLSKPMNPSSFNPLRDLLGKSVDFAALRANPPIRLLIAATKVRDGRLHLFRETELTLDMVLASACLPTLNRAIEIEGEAYWDGGLSANPPMRQVVRESRSRDIVLVQIMPEAREAVPNRSADVLRRLGEMAFTAPLQRELEALADLRELCRQPGALPSASCSKLDALRFHRIAAEDVVEDLDQQSAMDISWSLITRLHEKGREAAAFWISRSE